MGKKSKRRRDRREKVGAVVGSKAGPASGTANGNHDAGGVPKRLKKIPEAARMFDKSSAGCVRGRPAHFCSLLYGSTPPCLQERKRQASKQAVSS